LREGGVEALSFATFAADSERSAMIFYWVSGRDLASAAQTGDGKTERNDRLIAVAAESHTHSSLKSLGMLDSELIKEIEHFFVSYNQIRGKSSN